MGANNIVVKKLASTGIRVMSNSMNEKIYLEADNILKRIDALFYINRRGTPLDKSRDKQPSGIIEI